MNEIDKTVERIGQCRTVRREQMASSDITKCTNDECSRRELCFRWTCPSDSIYQSSARFEPTQDFCTEFHCEYFRSNRSEEKAD